MTTKRKSLPVRIKRSRRKCEICDLFDPDIIEAHHIIKVSEGGDDSEHNVPRLCPNCHTKVHAGQYTNLHRCFTTRGWILFFDGGDPSRRYPGEVA